jgi:hypothetical protein
MGWFAPTEIGERLMPALTFLGPFHDRITRGTEDSLHGGQALSSIERTALGREALNYKVSDEAGVALDALRLELRGNDGKVISTEHISVQDTEYLATLGDRLDETELDDFGEDDPYAADEFDSGLIELGIEEPCVIPDDWNLEPEDDSAASALPRYQVFVRLADPQSVPVSNRWQDDPYVQSLVAGFDPLGELKED